MGLCWNDFDVECRSTWFKWDCIRLGSNVDLHGGGIAFEWVTLWWPGEWVGLVVID